MLKHQPIIIVCSATVQEINEAFELSVHGFFAKTLNRLGMMGQIQCVLEHCREGLEATVPKFKLEHYS